MVKFYLPGLFELFQLYVQFIEIFQQEKEKFREFEIGAIYGAPQGTLWNGGRVKGLTYVDNIAINNWCIENNINCALTFTNSLIEEEHLDDVFSNKIAKLFENENNTIIVNSDFLENYLREKYPKYNFVSSTTKCITDFEELKKELKKDYKRVVLDYNFNKQLDILEQIEEKEKCEILINAVCKPNCEQRKKHYHAISMSVLNKEAPEIIVCNCMFNPFYEALKNKNSLTVDEIYNIYEPLGFEHFKIEGRTNFYQDVIEILVYYMVKPEFQMEIRQRLNNHFWQH